MRLYLFDLDGTLADSRAGLYSSFRAGLEVLGIGEVPDEALAQFLGAPLPIVFRAFRPDVSLAMVQRGMQAFRAHYELKGIHGSTLYPGVRKMLQAVRAVGARAWIVTSKPDEQAKRVAKLLKIDGLVEGVVGAGLEELDTKADLIGRALFASHVPETEALMLGDRHYDVVGARATGVLPVGALWGYGSREELADAGCTLFVDSADEFRADYICAAPVQRRQFVARLTRCR